LKARALGRRERADDVGHVGRAGALELLAVHDLHRRGERKRRGSPDARSRHDHGVGVAADLHDRSFRDLLGRHHLLGRHCLDLGGRFVRDRRRRWLGRDGLVRGPGVGLGCRGGR
jgi:hypothetical protein